MPNGIGYGGGGGSGGGVPSDIPVITSVPDATLTAEQALSLLSTGLLLNTGGTLSTAVGSDLPSHNHAASEVASGTLDVARIPSLPASQITSGQLALARGGTGADLSATGGANQIVRQNSLGGVLTVSVLVSGDIPSLPASKITSGQLALAQGGTNVDLSAGGGSGFVLKQAAGGVITSAALVAGDIPSLAASKITSGQLSLAQGGTNVDLSSAGGANFVLHQAAGGVISSSAITAADITTALASPPAIGATAQSTAYFTTVKTPIIFPNADGTQAVKIAKADGSTAVITVDTTNSRVSIGNSGVAPTNTFTIIKSNTPSVYPVYIENSDTGSTTTSVDWIQFKSTNNATSVADLLLRASHASSIQYARLETGDSVELVSTRNAGCISLFGTQICYIEIGGENFIQKAGNNLFVYNAALFENKDAGTNAIFDEIYVRHNSTSTPAAGFGTGIRLEAKSSTTTNTLQARLASIWNVATHASRVADAILYVSDANAEREIWRGRANGSAPAIAFLGATPAIQQTGGSATATIAYTATEQSMLQKAYDALRTFGLLS